MAHAALALLRRAKDTKAGGRVSRGGGATRDRPASSATPRRANARAVECPQQRLARPPNRDRAHRDQVAAVSEGGAEAEACDQLRMNMGTTRKAGGVASASGSRSSGRAQGSRNDQRCPALTEGMDLALT